MVSRPQIPAKYTNPKLASIDETHLPHVKYQILNCQGNDILVGRLKVETPTDTGHAFILRRFDTEAISLTTMFRAAFPTAPEADEKAEINWVRENYDLSGNNGSTKDTHITRLAGTWVSPDVALELGQDYGLGPLIKVVAEAHPDPTVNYRRSGKASAPAHPPATSSVKYESASVTKETITTTTASPAPVFAPLKSASASKSLPTPSPTAADPPSKRRKASSPVPASPRPSRIPSRASPAPTPTSDRVIAPLRRSTRASPAPRSAAATTVVRTPKSTRAAKKESTSTVTVTVSSSGPSGDLEIVDEETMTIEDGILGSGLREEDVAEQAKLIRDIGKQLHADGDVVQDLRAAMKRSLEEQSESAEVEVVEPAQGEEEPERVIATNQRVAAQSAQSAQSKSLFWGVAAFAVGVGSVFLPNLF